MNKGTLISIGLSTAFAVVAGSVSISAQDKYGVKVPNGLGFEEFKGYEDWPVIAISLNSGKLAVITGNPAMMDAFRQGIPGNGKAFPDGARMAKDPLEPQEAGGLSRPADGARRPARRRLHGQGQQAVRRQRRMGMGGVRVQRGI